MQHKRPPLPAIFLIVLIIAAGVYYGFRTLNSPENGALSASGTIESVVVNVSPQIAGRVKEVRFNEGQPVKMGDPLLSLDDRLLAAQREVAQRGVDSAHQALLTAQSAYNLAQAQYDAALTAARAQEGGQRLTDWANRTPGQFDQPLWYFSRDEQITSAQAQVESAQQALQQAQTNLESVVKDLNNANFVAAETRLSNARLGYLIDKGVYNRSQLTGGKVRPEDVYLNVDLPPYVPAYRVKIRVAKGLTGDSDVVTIANDALDVAET